jgi:hypothetical protein
MSVVATAVLSSGCDIGKLTVNTTSKVLVRAQPSLKQESDFEMARRAIPGTLKTVEGFHYVDPSNERLKKILAEGYCQYASAFIEDDWEVALFAKNFDDADYHSKRATNAFLRCSGYALELLGKKWSRAVMDDPEVLRALAAKAGKGSRDAMMWLAFGMAGAINQNKDDINMVAHLSKAKILFERILQIDEKHGHKDKALQALPYIAMGMLNTTMSKALGGKPEIGKEYFQKAISVTEGKYLLPKVLFAKAYAKQVQNKDLFRKTLIEVLQTDPAVWPDQRLANEVAHRRARRYLKMEKEWF